MTFYLGILLRTTAQETAFHIALRNHSKEEREEPGCTGVFCWEQTNKQNKQIKKKKHTTTAEHKRLLLIIKNRHLELMILAFLCIGRCKDLGSLKLSLTYAS